MVDVIFFVKFFFISCFRLIVPDLIAFGAFFIAAVDVVVVVVKS